MNTLQEILEKLTAAARPDQLEGMARYGMTPEKRLGVSVPELRRIAKETRKNHVLSLELWQTGIPEARMVASMIGDPVQLTEEQMEEWVVGFNSWDVCDQVCMNLFEKSPLAWKKIVDWSSRPEEYVRRAAYALAACLAWHDKNATDEQFIQLLPLIKLGATDDRNFVKKAVSWAMRKIGKRNLILNQAVVELAKQIGQLNSKASRWIAADVIRELTNADILRKLKG